MEHELKVIIISALKESLYIKDFTGDSEEEINDVIVFLSAFILMLKKKDLQVVPFQFELILKQPILTKFDTQDWEAMLLNALDMSKTDKVDEDEDEKNIAYGQALTATQFIIALLICNDLTDMEVAEHSFKTLNSVRKHHGNINIKLGVSSQLGIYKKMVELGLFPPTLPLVA